MREEQIYIKKHQTTLKNRKSYTELGLGGGVFSQLGGLYYPPPQLRGV